MTPLERYQLDLKQDGFFPDDAQLSAIEQLQGLFDELIKQIESRNGEGGGAFNKLYSAVLSRVSKRGTGERFSPVPGIYFWGGVGRGKTWLMDVFYECLPFEEKMRTHFHRFMQRVHGELAQLKGHSNPLQLVAKKIADEARVICFDEFFVSDIGDAMILAGLLEELLALNVTFVMTSNIRPEGLYENGLQRARFLPAIELIQEHTKIIELDGGVDYRLRSLEQARIYYSPLDNEADAELQLSFKRLAPDFADAEEAAKIDILGRQLQSRYCADDVVWFEFDELCNGPRSAYDYIELAKIYHAVLIGNVPQLTAGKEEAARRFISLVDEFYDRNVKLIISAEVDLPHLYCGTELSFAFERTQSRLLEMQSHDYLAREHLP